MGVGILGATGAVGQRFIQLLVDHPWFEIAELAASDRSAGKPYREATTWRLATPLPKAIADRTVQACDAPFRSKILFSGLDSSVAGEVETMLAGRGHAVVSNARNHRMDPDVPLLIPEVNPDHLDALAVQRRRTRSGYIVTNPNCSVVGLAMALAPLERSFGLESVTVVTLQALSGAGYPGVASLDATDNVDPLHRRRRGGEDRDRAAPHPGRVPRRRLPARALPDLRVRASRGGERRPHDGHLREARQEGLSGGGGTRARRVPGRAAGAGAADRAPGPDPRPHGDGPAAAAARPRPRERDGGLASAACAPTPYTTCELEALVHNTIRGAAGAAILNAELLQARGLLP